MPTFSLELAFAVALLATLTASADAPPADDAPPPSAEDAALIEEIVADLEAVFGGSDPIELPDGKCSRVCCIDDLR